MSPPALISNALTTLRALNSPASCPYSQMSSGWPVTPNGVILSPDVGCLQTAVVAVPRVVPIAGVTRRRELGPASADHCPAAHRAEEALLQYYRPGDLRRPLSTVSGPARCLAVVRPETVIRWHRAGFRAYWRWRSRPRRGRPTVPLEIRQLIREMSLANPLWELHGSMANCSNSASLSGRRVWPSIWRGGEGHRHRAGGHFYATMQTASPPWTCSWCRRFLSGFSMVF